MVGESAQRHVIYGRMGRTTLIRATIFIASLIAKVTVLPPCLGLAFLFQFLHTVSQWLTAPNVVCACLSRRRCSSVSIVTSLRDLVSGFRVKWPVREAGYSYLLLTLRVQGVKGPRSARLHGLVKHKDSLILCYLLYWALGFFRSSVKLDF
jgi:hypothetical protein